MLEKYEIAPTGAYYRNAIEIKSGKYEGITFTTYNVSIDFQRRKIYFNPMILITSDQNDIANERDFKNVAENILMDVLKLSYIGDSPSCTSL